MYVHIIYEYYVCKLKQKSAKICKNLQKSAKICKNLQKSTKIWAKCFSF
jgi:hypothetical protein